MKTVTTRRTFLVLLIAIYFLQRVLTNVLFSLPRAGF